jgi:hypothetical protein
MTFALKDPSIRKISKMVRQIVPLGNEGIAQATRLEPDNGRSRMGSRRNVPRQRAN